MEGNDLAANGSFGTFNPVQIFSGEMDIITDHGTVAAATTLEKFRVLAYDVNGNLTAWVPGAADSTNKIVGIAAQPITTAAGDTAQSIPFWKGGCFNFDLLVKPAGVTVQQMKALLALTTLGVEKLFG